MMDQPLYGLRVAVILVAAVWLACQAVLLAGQTGRPDLHWTGRLASAGAAGGLVWVLWAKAI